jgi:hypothetical protein
VPRQLCASPRATLLTIAALTSFGGLLAAAPIAAQAAHARHGVRAVAASLTAAEREERAAERAAEREARRQERAQLRAKRIEERTAARAERQAERAQRRAERAQQHPAHHQLAAEGEGGQAPASPSPGTPATSARGCRVSIETSSSSITAGEAVTVFGKVSCPPASEPGSASGAGADAGRQVSIEQTLRSGGGVRSFSALGTVSTEADGSYQLPPVTLQANTIFRVRLGKHGAHTSVSVAPVVTLNAPAPVPSAQRSSVDGHTRLARHGKTLFTGTVAPAASGARVALQVAYPADGERWRTIAYGDVVDGSFSISRGFKIPGEAKVRILAHPKGANAPGVSEEITYLVPQAQNPQLTLIASADPISDGQSVTLSGVAAGAAGQTLTLLARTGGGKFAPVATTTADEAGNYQFVQAPTENTYYEVSDAATRSFPLFEGVKYALTLSPPPASVAAGEALTLSGTVTPARAGQTVYLDRRGPSGVGYHPIAAAAVDPDGTFVLSHTFESTTSPTLRVRLAGNPQNQGGASAPFAVTVTTAAAAALGPEPVAPTS